MRRRGSRALGFLVVALLAACATVPAPPAQRPEIRYLRRPPHFLPRQAPIQMAKAAMPAKAVAGDVAPRRRCCRLGPGRDRSQDPARPGRHPHPGEFKVNGLQPQQLLEQVVRPTLNLLDFPGTSGQRQVAERLVMGTGAHESMGFTRLHQDGKGPALGLFQMEPTTFYDLWRRTFERNDRQRHEASAEELALIWKTHYNTPEGAGRPEQFVNAYRELIAPLYPEED